MLRLNKDEGRHLSMVQAKQRNKSVREQENQESMQDQPNNPLHGITLLSILTELVEFYGFERLGELITIRCFTHDPSIKSSLKFLRKTPWARTKVEALYINSQEIEGFPTPAQSTPAKRIK
jgi:uncharacterized protein (DUF2132 family)